MANRLICLTVLSLTLLSCKHRPGSQLSATPLSSNEKYRVDENTMAMTERVFSGVELPKLDPDSLEIHNRFMNSSDEALGIGKFGYEGDRSTASPYDLISFRKHMSPYSRSDFDKEYIAEIGIQGTTRDKQYPDEYEYFDKLPEKTQQVVTRLMAEQVLFLKKMEHIEDELTSYYRDNGAPFPAQKSLSLEMDAYDRASWRRHMILFRLNPKYEVHFRFRNPYFPEKNSGSVDDAGEG